MTLAELEIECRKRNINTDSFESIVDFINALIKSDSTPPDWGKIYARILFHTGMAYEEIARRTIPQIMAILDGAEENIAIKLGLPNIFGGGISPVPSELADKPPQLGQFMAFANAFDRLN